LQLIKDTLYLKLHAFARVGEKPIKIIDGGHVFHWLQVRMIKG